MSKLSFMLVHNIHFGRLIVIAAWVPEAQLSLQFEGWIQRTRPKAIFWRRRWWRR